MEPSDIERVESYKFEAVLSSGSDATSLKEAVENGRFVQFVVTDTWKIFISEKGHDDIRYKDCLMHEDILQNGFFRIENTGLRIGYRDSTNFPSGPFKEAVLDTISKFINKKFNVKI